MKISKKILTLTLLVVMMTYTIRGMICTSSNGTARSPVRVGVLLSTSDDLYLSLVQKNLEDIQIQNSNKVEFTFFDGKGNPAIQNATVDSLVQGNVDLLLVNLVDRKANSVQDLINKARLHKVPIILFNIVEPEAIDILNSYPKALAIATDIKQSGILEGKILVDAWNTDKLSIDKNRDNKLQYIMLQGDLNSSDILARTKYSVSTINDAGIKTEELAAVNANLNKETAKLAIDSLFLRYGDKVEAIISNNDAMAIGAIESLQKYGYNKGDKTKTIQVVGIDAIPLAQDLIKKGFMAGSVILDPRLTAEALYKVGMNLVSNADPLEGTNYKFDDTGVVIRLPYEEYKK